ncbi:MAG: radical SAM protein [Methanomassiliicoccales archaeon]|nr:MAG: radical SAM protein [Methanomassiliicoccales archaeon]
MANLISLSQYMYYARWFVSSLFGRKRPLVNTMIINFECNLRCKHCSIRGNQDALPGGMRLNYEEAVEEMRSGFEKGARILFFEGGEPTMWKDGGKTLEDLIEAGRSIGYFVTGYTTNGTNAIYTNSDVISVSLDGPKEVHDRIRCEGVFDKLMANLEKVDHPNIFANMVLMRENKDHLRETVEVVAKSKKINGIMLNFLTPPPNGQKLTLEEKRRLVAEAIALKREGLPILNSDRALKELLIEDYERKCRDWVSMFVLPDRSHHYGCPMRGTASCKECGFNAVREYSLITRGNVSAILQMSKRFAFSKE